VAEVLVAEEEFRRARPAQRAKLREVAARLRKEPFLGDRIPQRLVPKRFRRYPNLFRLELPGAWRALNSVLGDSSRGLEVRVVWVGDHTRYDRLFGYG
jgi:hypothetical protein